MAVKSSSQGQLASICEVDIDEDGVFKYILVQIKGDGCSKYIVRGYGWAEYHADVYEKVEESIGKVQSICVGGGRIRHNSAKKNIVVYGYSVGFGQANHAITVDILRKHYPDYKSITWNNDGY